MEMEDFINDVWEDREGRWVNLLNINIFISVYWELNGWAHLENLVILQRKILECEVLPLVIMKSVIILDVTSCNLMKVNQHFGEMDKWRSLRGWKVCQAQNQHEAGSK
jgi:hypothetical protein